MSKKYDANIRFWFFLTIFSFHFISFCFVFVLFLIQFEYFTASQSMSISRSLKSDLKTGNLNVSNKKKHGITNKITKYRGFHYTSYLAFDFYASLLKNNLWEAREE